MLYSKPVHKHVFAVPGGQSAIEKACFYLGSRPIELDSYCLSRQVFGWWEGRTNDRGRGGKHGWRKGQTSGMRLHEVKY